MSDCEFVNAIANGVLALSAGAAAVFAWRGLETWRLQLRGQAEYDLARRLLKAIYECRDAIGVVRNPFFTSDEMYEAYKAAGGAADTFDLDAFQSFKDWPTLFQKRWDQLSKAQQVLRLEAIEGEVLWGDSCRGLVTELFRCISWLHVHLREYLSLKEQLNILSGPSRERYEVVSKIVENHDEYEMSDFGRKLENAITSIEGFLRPHLAPPGATTHR